MAIYALIHAGGQNPDGSPDRETIERCESGARLFRDREYHFLFITTAKEKNGRQLANEMKQILLRAGVPNEKIQVLPRARDESEETAEFEEFLCDISTADLVCIAV